MWVAASRECRFAMNSGDRTRELTVHARRFSCLFVVAIVVVLVESAVAATINTRPLTTTSHSKSRSVKENPRAGKHMRHLARSRRAGSRRVVVSKRRRHYE